METKIKSKDLIILIQGSHKLFIQKESLITLELKATSSSNTFQKSRNIIKFSFM
jgi:hypothetical protein